MQFEIIAALSEQAWSSMRHRDVQHYGYRFDYDTNLADASAADSGIETPCQPLPPFCGWLLKRLPGDAATPDQLTVNRYPVGGGIAPHVDTHSAFGPVITSVSLGAGATMAWLSLFLFLRLTMVLGD